MKTAIYEVAEKIRAIAHEDTPVLVAVDGRCAAGKTTLAANLHKMSVDQEEQLRRIALRGGEESVRQFKERWIPPTVPIYGWGIIGATVPNYKRKHAHSS